MVVTVSPGGRAASAVGEGEEEAGQFDGRLNRYEESIGPWCPPCEGCAWAADEAGGFTFHGARPVRDAQGRVHHGMPGTGWMPRAARVRASRQATTAGRDAAARRAEVNTSRSGFSGRGNSVTVGASPAHTRSGSSPTARPERTSRI